MKIVIKDVEIHLLPADHMLIIFEPDAVIFKCTVCAGTKDIHYLMTINSEQPLPFDWMKTCTCGNAPRSGGDSRPVDEQEKPDIASIAEEVAKSIRTSELSMPTFRFIDNRGTSGY